MGQSPAHGLDRTPDSSSNEVRGFESVICITLHGRPQGLHSRRERRLSGTQVLFRHFRFGSLCDMLGARKPSFKLRDAEHRSLQRLPSSTRPGQR